MTVRHPATLTASTSTRPEHQLVRRRGEVTEHDFEVTFNEPGVRAYVFTFG